MLWHAASGALVQDFGKVAPSVARGGDWHAYNRCAWAPDGTRLLCPGRNNDVVLFSLKATDGASGAQAAASTTTWSEAARLKDGHLGDVSLIAPSPNGLFVATAGMDMSVLIWDLRSLGVVSTAKVPDAATGLAWRAACDANALAVLTFEGSVALWERPVSSRLPPPSAPLEEIDLSEFETAPPGGFLDDSAVDGGADGGDGGEEEGEEEEESGSDGGEAAQGKKAAGRTRTRIVMVPAPVAPTPEAQAAVAAGCTEFAGAPARRFLAYNLLGCITCRDDGAAQYIETHFHDLERAGARMAGHTDHLGVTLAALGPAGVAYASPAAEDSAGTLSFRPARTDSALWAGSGEWTVALGGGELPVALAVGGSFLALATSRRLLRVFSPMGAQLALLSLDGPPVALAAHGGLLACAWQAGPPSGPPPSEQALAYALFDTHAAEKLAQGPLPLSGRAQLAWLGFSEQGCLAAADSAGILRQRSCHFGGAWVPLFDSCRARSSDIERHWVVGLNAVELYAVVCKAPDAAPTPSPRPVLSVFPLATPVLGADANADVAALEDGTLRARLNFSEATLQAQRSMGLATHQACVAAYDAAELALNRALLVLFAAVLKADRVGRASELLHSMTMMPVLEGALKLANQMRLTALAGRVKERIEALQALDMVRGEAHAADFPTALQATARQAPQQVTEGAGGKFARRAVAAAAPPPAPVEAVSPGEENHAPAGGRKRDAPVPEAPAAKRAAAGNPFARK